GVHKACAIAGQTVLFRYSGKPSYESLAVDVVDEHGSIVDSMRSEVIDAARLVDAGASSHGVTMAGELFAR
ncbi:MAG TPA: hypothetical protein VGL84_03690, partial [Gaiellaceae bacterium]